MTNATKRKAKKRTLNTGIINIKATFNNTIITITDVNGEAVSWASGGTSGFKGSRKSTPFAAQEAMKKALQVAISYGLKTASVNVKGPGAGREPAVKVISMFDNVNITSINDKTPLPHNGCRRPKKRSV